MKPINYLLAGLLACALSACQKDDPNPVEKDLTGCPVNATCQTLFTERADVKENGTFKTGDYRLFWASTATVNPSISTTVFLRAPMAGDSFEIKGDEIRTKVYILTNCAACNLVPYLPFDGIIKGTNTTPGVAADKARWLIDAKIYRYTNAFTVKSHDTVRIKQYFTANFVHN